MQMSREAAQWMQNEEIYQNITIVRSNRGVGNEINAKYFHNLTKKIRIDKHKEKKKERKKERRKGEKEKRRKERKRERGLPAGEL